MGRSVTVRPTAASGTKGDSRVVVFDTLSCCTKAIRRVSVVRPFQLTRPTGMVTDFMIFLPTRMHKDYLIRVTDQFGDPFPNAPFQEEVDLDASSGLLTPFSGGPGNGTTDAAGNLRDQYRMTFLDSTSFAALNQRITIGNYISSWFSTTLQGDGRIFGGSSAYFY